MASSNLLRVTVETAYSVPDAWAPVPGQHPSTYTVALEVPLTAEVRHREEVTLRLATREVFIWTAFIIALFMPFAFSLKTRKIKCWSSVMGSWSLEESGRNRAGRRRGPIRRHLFRGTITCLTPSSKQSLLSRRTARWLAVRYHKQYCVQYFVHAAVTQEVEQVSSPASSPVCCRVLELTLPRTVSNKISRPPMKFEVS